MQQWRARLPAENGPGPPAHLRLRGQLTTGLIIWLWGHLTA